MREDELFIGRRAICERFRRDVFFVEDGSYGHSYSLIGPNGIGKTTLIRHLSDELEAANLPNVYYFSTVLEDISTTFWGYWSELILQFADVIDEDKLNSAPNKNDDVKERILKVYQFFNDNLDEINEEKFLGRAISHLNRIFKYYTKLGIRIIITIDEFDRAKDIFKDGRFFQRLFGLTEKGASNLNLSIITISRRSVSTIAHHMQEGSNFLDAFPAEALRGFNNDELEEYFSTYKELPTGELSESTRQQIICLCGRSPGLLMSMRHEIMHFGTADIGEIYSQKSEFIKNAFNRMCTLMETEYVDRNKSITSMSVFIQQFIGPVYTKNLREKVDRLYDYGFITRADPNEENVFELSGLKEYRDKESLIYEPLSPFFVDYIKDVIVPNDEITLAGLLERTERAVRQVLFEALSLEYPDTWETVLSDDVPQKDDYLEQLRIVAARNDSASRNISISKLNVLAFNDYFKIIRNHWDIMSGYFTLYDSRSALQADMKLLNTCRNTSAHLNLEILNDPGREDLKKACELMLKSMAIAQEKEAGGADDRPERSLNELDSYIGREVELTQLEVTSLGGLRGIISGASYGASLSRNHLREKGVSAYAYLGQTVRVRITRWDYNAQKFNSELIG